MSGHGAALHRLLLQRAGADRCRVFLSDWFSTDWQSLTFTGERHRAHFVFTGRDAGALAERWAAGIEEAEFDLPSGFVADIAVVGGPAVRDDGAALVELEALTLAD